MADKFEPSWAVGDKNTWDALVRSMMAGGIGLVDTDGEKTPISSDFGGSPLPEVSTADNGDVLTVVEGEWAKAAPSGGGKSVASVRVTFSGFAEGSISFATCYGEYVPSREMYSMVSPANEIHPNVNQRICFVPMCISDETYKAIIAFDEFMFEGCTFEVSGNIAQPAVDVQVPSSPTTWYSNFYYGFIVNGDGAINVIAP